MTVPQALQELDPASLVGLPLDEAAELVTAAGGHVRAVPPGSVVTADYRPDRVTLIVEHGLVVECAGIG